MDTKGLYLGIDIDENISQVCFYDERSRNVQPVSGKDENPYFNNAVPLSTIYANTETSVSRLSSMTEALIAAASCQTGEEKLRMLGVCMRDLSEEKRRIWHEALAGIGIGPDRYILMCREETFAYYAFSADPGTYTRGVALYELNETGLDGCFLQRVTYKGLTLLTETDEKADSEIIKKAGTGEVLLKEAKGELGTFFRSTLDKNPVSSVYLTGEAFDAEELPDDLLSILGRGGHRIFAGMNLYVKGACIGALTRVFPNADPLRNAGINKTVGIPGSLSRCIMACRNRISSRISIAVREKGELNRRTLVDRGSNVDASCMTFECYPGEKGEIQLAVEPLTQNTPDIYTVKLQSDNDFSKKLVRVNVTLYFPDEDNCDVFIDSEDGAVEAEDFSMDLTGSGQGMTRTATDGVIFCEQPKARVPYVFPATGDEIYSAEELVKYLYENVYLAEADGGVINSEMFTFLKEQAGCGVTAEKLEELSNSGASLKELLLTLFRDVNYYSPQDITIMEPVIDGLKTGKRALVKYGRAESYIKCGCITKGLKELLEIMELNPDSELPEKFYAKVLYNAGVCYGRCLMYEKSAEMFEGAYGFVKDEETKTKALLARALSDTEPGILYMKGEWEQARERAGELRSETCAGTEDNVKTDERIEQLESCYLRKYF